MGRSRTRKLRPRAPLFPFAGVQTPNFGPLAPAKAPSTKDELNPANDSDSNSNGEAAPPLQSKKTDLPVSPRSSSGEENLLEQVSKSEEKPVSADEPEPVTEKPKVTQNTVVPATTTPPMNHHDSMCFLKIIGSIQSGQKLRHSSNNPNQPISIDPNQWSSSVTRWWNGDSRTMSIKVLRGRFDNVFKNIDEAYDLHKNPTKEMTNAFHRSPKDILLDYARELSGAEKGLRHLCHTYKSDIPIASELQVMLESVSIRKQTIDSMFTISDK